MDFPLYKEWIGETNRISNNHVNGAQKFVKYNFRNLKSDKIPCSCTYYMNEKYKSLEYIELHLIKWGIFQDYKIWTYHGEKNIPYIPEKFLVPDRITKPQRVEVVHYSPTYYPLTDLIDDAYKLNNHQNHQPIDMDNAHYGQLHEKIDVELPRD